MSKRTKPDYREYLDLEDGLQKKLREAWAPTAVSLYNRMATLVSQAKFDDARAVADTIDLSSVGDENKESIKAYLLAFLQLGAELCNGSRTTFTSFGNHDALLDHVTKNFVASIALNVTIQTRQAALQSIADAEADYSLTQKAEKKRFLRNFVDFSEQGDEMLQLISSLHSSRLSTWGFVAEAEVLDVEEYRLTAVLDGRTSKFCRAINGKVFKVKDAREFVNVVLNVENPDDLRIVQPWPKQTKQAIERYSAMTADELTAEGLHIPPYHPSCRTLLTHTKKGAPRTGVPVVPPDNQILPSQVSTPETFRELGLDTEEDHVKYWNEQVGVSPVTALSKVTGATPLELLDRSVDSKVAINMQEDGDILMTAKDMPLAKGSYSGTTLIDPVQGALYQRQASFKGTDIPTAVGFVKSLYGGLVDLGLSMGATSLVVASSGAGIATHAAAGFSTSAAGWYDLRDKMLTALNKTELAVSEKNVVSSLLASKDENAIQALVRLPYTIDGVQIGKYLLNGLNSEMVLDLGSLTALTLLKGFVNG